MHEKSTLDKLTLNYLSCDNKTLRIGCMYLLPKIHKVDENILERIHTGDIQNVPNPNDRPIITQIGTAY